MISHFLKFGADKSTEEIKKDAKKFDSTLDKIDEMLNHIDHTDPYYCDLPEYMNSIDHLLPNSTKTAKLLKKASQCPFVEINYFALEHAVFNAGLELPNATRVLQTETAIFENMLNDIQALNKKKKDYRKNVEIVLKSPKYQLDANGHLEDKYFKQNKEELDM